MYLVNNLSWRSNDKKNLPPEQCLNICSEAAETEDREPEIMRLFFFFAQSQMNHLQITIRWCKMYCWHIFHKSSGRKGKKIWKFVAKIKAKLKKRNLLTEVIFTEAYFQFKLLLNFKTSMMCYIDEKMSKLTFFIFIGLYSQDFC